MRPGRVRLPNRVDFYRLPRPVQDRFAAATRRTAPPAPLLFRRAPRTAVWASLGAGFLAALLALALLRAGIGRVTSPLALHGPKLLALDLALWAAAAYGVVHAMSLLRALDTLPFKAGTYLFPACVVEALGPVLRVWPVAVADAVERAPGPSPAVSLRMRDGSRVTLPARRPEDAERVERALASVRDKLARAVAQDDAHVLAELDPLHDSALSSPIGPSEPMTYRPPAWTRFDWAVAAGAGVALGFTLVQTRNAVSDDAMYRAVAASGAIPGYEAYLAQGGRHAAEIRDVLLPRAELRVAEPRGVEAVEAFAEAHPGSKIQPEIDAALRRVLLAKLDEARKAGTVAALDELATRYPDNGLAPELAAARHALYAQAFAAWKRQARPNAATASFFERLLAWAEKSPAPAAEVRFRLEPSKTLDDADKSVTKNPRYPGPDALPSHYLSPDAMLAREQKVAQDLVRGFAAEFPADVLVLRAADRLPAGAPAATASPTLVVAYSPEWSRSNTTSIKPSTVFAGADFAFDCTFTLPSAGAPLVVKTKSWRGAELWKMKSEGLTRQDFEQKVYDNMIDGAFDQLGKRLRDVLL